MKHHNHPPTHLETHSSTPHSRLSVSVQILPSRCGFAPKMGTYEPWQELTVHRTCSWLPF